MSTERHLLLHKWTFWFDSAEYQTVSGQSNQGIAEIMDFDNVENFWGLHKEIPKAGDLMKGTSMHLLRYGIKQSEIDGIARAKLKFTIDISKADKIFETLMLIAIGENLDQAKFMDGLSFSISAQARFTLYFNEWDEKEGKYFKDDLVDMLGLSYNHKFDLFKDKTRIAL